jgi:hypothetical protein
VSRAIIAFVHIFLVISITGKCRAQTRLSLQEAVNRALQSRASLKAGAELVTVAEGMRKQAGLHPNPEFQFQNENLRPGQTYGRDVDTLALINQPLDVLGKRKQRIALAGEGVVRSQADYELARWQVTKRVKFTYWAARGSQEIYDVLRTTADNFQKIVDYHSAQLSVGAIAEQDLLRVRLEGERLKISADLAFIDVNRSRVELLKEMGQTEFGEVVLTEPLTLDSVAVPAGIEQALAQRMEIKAARAALEQARANARLQEVSARPDLSLTYGYKRMQLPDTTDGVNTAIGSLTWVFCLTPVWEKVQPNKHRAHHRPEQLRHKEGPEFGEVARYNWHAEGHRGVKVSVRAAAGDCRKDPTHYSKCPARGDGRPAGALRFRMLEEDAGDNTIAH